MPDGDVLTLVAGHQAFAAPSGVQAVSLLGPVTVRYNDPDISGNFGMVRIGELVPGAVVVKTWAVMTVDWLGTVTELHLAISDTSDGNATVDLNVLSLDSDDTSSSPDFAREISTGAWGAFGASVVSFVGIAGPDGAWLLAYFGSGTMTAGVLDVYALIAEPA